MPPLDIGERKLLDRLRQCRYTLHLLRGGHLAISFDQERLDVRMGVIGRVAHCRAVYQFPWSPAARKGEEDLGSRPAWAQNRR